MKNLILMVFLTSPFLVMMSKNWFFLWFMMEINTLTFIFLMKSMMNKNEEMIKYFLVQMSTSIFILIMYFYWEMKNNFMAINLNKLASPLMIMVALLKMGMIPFHFWMIPIIKNLNWKLIFLILTWQKFIPIFIISMINLNNIWIMLTMSILISTVMQYNMNNMSMLILFSSIANLSWFNLMAFYNEKKFILMIMIYTLNMIILLKIMKEENLKKINFSMNTMMAMLMLMTFMSIGGIPPMSGFFIKWMMMNEMLLMPLMFMMGMLITTSILNMFIYLQLMFTFLMKNMKMNMKFKSMKYKIFMLIQIMLPITMMI